MAYEYSKERHLIFTEDGVPMLREIAKQAEKLIKIAGCAMLQNIISTVTGDTFMMLACIDYLVEKGELRKIDREGVSTQYKIYLRGASL